MCCVLVLSAKRKCLIARILVIHKEESKVVLGQNAKVFSSLMIMKIIAK